VIIRDHPESSVAKLETITDWTPVTKGKKSTVVSSDPGCDRRLGHFWALEYENDEEGEIATPTTEELVVAASRVSISIEQLIQAETELQEICEVRQVSSDSLGARCPHAGKIIRAILRGKSLKHHTKPWSGPLPRPRISPPWTLGDAVIKNSCIRL
jgi:hypothetical protein